MRQKNIYHFINNNTNEEEYRISVQLSIQWTHSLIQQSDHATTP